jgi:hypothetical protein
MLFSSHLTKLSNIAIITSWNLAVFISLLSQQLLNQQAILYMLLKKDDFDFKGNFLPSMLFLRTISHI